MAKYIRSISTPQETVTVDTVDTKDLPVNPISFLLLHLKFLNAGARTKATLANILATLDQVTVKFRGTSVIALSGEDLFAYGTLLWRRFMQQVNVVDLDNAVRSFTLPIPFGLRPFDPDFAFPATARGNLVIDLDWAASFTNLDGLSFAIEVVELPEATPSRWLRATTLSLTPGATGDNDMALPIGNPLLMAILFGTTIPTGTTTTRTINAASLLADNQQIYVPRIEFESLHNAMGLRVPGINPFDDHHHLENSGGAYAQYADTASAEQDDHILAQYGLIDFDPLDDGSYLLDTAGLADLKLRIDAGDTNAVRVIPVEVHGVAG